VRYKVFYNPILRKVRGFIDDPMNTIFYMWNNSWVHGVNIVNDFLIMLKGVSVRNSVWESKRVEFQRFSCHRK